MDGLERSLYEFTGRELYESTWMANLPIHHGVGLASFFDSFRDNGVGVINDNVRKSAEFTLLWRDELYSCEMKYDEIVRGWGHNPPSSPRTLYDSICMVLDKMGSDIKDPKIKNNWETFRSTQSRQFREKMEENIEPWFVKYHEHVLLPINQDDSNGTPELKSPEIFHEIMKDYPFSLHLNAVMRQGDGCSSGPCPEFIDETDWNCFDDDYYPSDAAMTQYFWGYYLENLARKKGYFLRDKMLADKKQRVRMLIINGANGLENREFAQRNKILHPF